MKKFTELALFTNDVNALAAFYENLLGSGPLHRGPDMAIFDVHGIELLIHKKYEHELGQPSNEDHFALGVENVDAANTECKEKQLQVELEPRDYGWGRSAYLRDPDGRLVEIHQIKKT